MRFCHLPRGRCGLKSVEFKNADEYVRKSPSARKVWIEIVKLHCHLLRRHPSPSARKVWIEMYIWVSFMRLASSHLPRGRCGLKYLEILSYHHPTQDRSPSARKVWIEITLAISLLKRKLVTFREEGVDWNYSSFAYCLDLWQSHLPRGRCGLK